MRNIWTIAKREYDYYFISPIAYVGAFVIIMLLGVYFVLIMGYFRQNAFQSFGQTPDMSDIASLFSFLMIIFIPALTMRLVSEENRMGTIELLLTAPIKDSELIIGKWLGSFLFMLTLIAFTLVYPIIMNSFISTGAETTSVFKCGLDCGRLASTYLGLILLAGAMLSIGVGISAIFSNQIASLIATLLGGLFLWWAIGLPAVIASPTVGEVFRALTMNTHITSFIDGKVTLIGLSYFISLIALGLFTGTIAVETRRWR
jgi:ABC-2 type transport system permease protein